MDKTTFTDRIRNNFSPGVRRRGEEYAESGCVEDLHSDKAGISAVVTGGTLYDVHIQYHPYRGGLALRAQCTCPFFEQELDLCKHIWATLLAAEEVDELRHARRFDEGKAVEVFLDDAEGLADIVANEEDHEAMDEDEAHDRALYSRMMRAQENQARRLATKPPRRASTPPASGRRPGKARKRSRPRRGATFKPREWEKALGEVARRMRRGPDPIVESAGEETSWPPDRQVLYALLRGGPEDEELGVQIMARQPKRDGSWGKAKAACIGAWMIPMLPEPADHKLLTLLQGCEAEDALAGDLDYAYYAPRPSFYLLRPAVQRVIVPMLCETGRCVYQRGGYNSGMFSKPLHWSEEAPWSFTLTLEPDDADRSRRYVLRGHLERDGERLAVAEPTLLTAGGVMLVGETACRYEHHGAFAWIELLREKPEIPVPTEDARQMVERLMTLPDLPAIELPEPLRVRREQASPRPMVQVRGESLRRAYTSRLTDLDATLHFRYGAHTAAWTEPAPTFFDRDNWTLIERDRAAEAEAWRRLRQVGFREPARHQGSAATDLVISRRNLPTAVATLVAEGWLVEADGRLHRPAGHFRMDMRGSGVDWFELHGEASFDGQQVALPELLAALRQGEKFVTLDDGSMGLLPEEWLNRYTSLGELGERGEGGEIRFRANQVGLIDALLTQMPEVDFDAQIAEARRRLQRFSRIRPRKAPAGFRGELRPYQRDGLGWLHFLRHIGFGGCLADDMGLGKTIQVLALLASRRSRSAGGRHGKTPPTLVVAPRSLVHNWESEAARFTPDLRVLDHTGADRFNAAESGGADVRHSIDHFDDYDVILTTYGTLRRDIALLKDFRFDYVVLDEAQAIKNMATASAKAARLLQADHRLALSGTPIENHLGELFSLFEFLNPGMLGHAHAWKGKAGNGNGRADDAEAVHRELIANAVRPFVLRRTKQQVAPELPEKTEQTLYCDLEPQQRGLYNELRDHYREALMGRVDKMGLKRSKIQVLEALLRLRQAACHPGLIDKARLDARSAKLDTLLSHLAEVVDEGHKALVFSQFTSFLSIVRERLDAEGIVYEYLDGRTRKRKERVDRFQEDPDCRLFLISLKAGGLGLNLTAAEYVFLLDPWWNPAVEAQAIDRAHRIGQEQHVFAYRLIGRDTVEEKVVELQQSKRDLADAIIRADANLIRSLTVDDLRHLLS